MKISKIINNKFTYSIILILLGIFFIILANKNLILTRKNIGWILLIASSLYLINELRMFYFIRFHKNKTENMNSAESKIAYFLDGMKIKYVHKPKSEKDVNFFLPEYDLYVIYWPRGGYSKDKRLKVKKSFDKSEILLVEIFEDNLDSLNNKFAFRLLEALKKRK